MLFLDLNKKIQCVYKPINSKRNMSVYICNNCGTLFSLSKSNTYTSNPPPNLSVDADRSSIFYTKDIECEYYTRIINKILNKHSLNSSNELPSFSANLKSEIELYENFEIEKKQIHKKIFELKEKLLKKAGSLTKSRNKIFPDFFVFL